MRLLTLLAFILPLSLLARTLDVTLWRGETSAILLPDQIEPEAAAAPDGVKVRFGAMLPVRYAPSVHSLQRLEVCDRVVWGRAGAPTVAEISVGADVKPGNYRFGMFNLTVLNHVLPPATQWKYYLDLWQHPWAVARQAGVEPFSAEHFAAMRPVYELLASAGQKCLTVTILEQPWDHQCYDAYHSMVDDANFELFDKYVEFGRSCGIGPDISCYTPCPWRQAEKPGSEAFKKRWAPFLRNFAEHLKRKGWYENTIMSMDERSPADVKAIVDFIHECAPGMRIAMAGDRNPSDFQGIDLDVYSQVLQHVTPAFLEECKQRRERGFVTTHYVCCNPQRPNTFMASGPGEAFWLGAFPGVWGMDGFLRWAWCSWPADPANDATFGNWLPGDTFLVYPGGEPSWRFLELRNGIICAEKLRMLLEEGKIDAAAMEKLRGVYDAGAAVGGRVNFHNARRTMLDTVNSRGL